jgi:hypothetical protein
VSVRGSDGGACTDARNEGQYDSGSQQGSKVCQSVKKRDLGANIARRLLEPVFGVISVPDRLISV